MSSDEQPKKEPPNILPFLLLLAIVLVGVGAYWLGTRSGKGPEVASTDGAPAEATPDTFASGAPELKSQKLDAGSERWLAAAWADVNKPAEVRRVLEENAWLQDVLKQPLGKGFAGSWGAFLGSRGEDLNAQFKGAVAGLFTEQLLDAPYRLVWFSGRAAPGVPALVLPKPSNKAKAALTALDASVKRGEFTETHCPGEEPRQALEVKISRWVVAEHSLYGAVANERLVLGRSPLSVLHGLCIELPAMGGTADVELSFAPEVMGRETQTLAHVLGIGGPVKLALGVEGSALTPRGIVAPLTAPGRLDSAAASEELLKLIPAEVPVVMTAQLKLPEELYAETLAEFWSGKAVEKTLTRQVSIAWSPRGNPDVPVEVALIWSRPEDAEALKGIFSGSNAMSDGVACGQLVLASTPGFLAQFTQTCEGKRPSLLNAAPAVVKGLSEKSSLTFGVALGTLLSRLTHDGYQYENGGNPKAPPAEIQQAKEQLEGLPYVGFTGRAEGSALVPGGFKS